MEVRSTIRRTVAAAALVLLSGAAVAGVDAVAAPTGDFGIPPAPTDNPYIAPYDVSASLTTTLGKLGATVKVPDTTYLSYLRLCVEVIQQGSDDPANCPQINPPTTSFDSFDVDGFPVWIRADGPLWAKSPAGAPRQYGSYAPVTVRGLVGGKVVSATVHLNQPVAGGSVTPFRLSYLTTASPVPAEGGTVNARGDYPAQTIPAGSASRYLVEQAKISGALDVRVSDVSVAGQPVGVGNTCRTASPAALQLNSPAGVYDKTSSASSLRGKPGGFQPLNYDDPGSVQGNVSIPSFTGCRSAGLDSSAIVTALVSGSRNATDFDLTRALTDCNNPSRTQACPAYPTSEAKATR